MRVGYVVIVLLAAFSAGVSAAAASHPRLSYSIASASPGQLQKSGDVSPCGNFVSANITKLANCTSATSISLSSPCPNVVDGSHLMTLSTLSITCPVHTLYFPLLENVTGSLPVSGQRVSISISAPIVSAFFFSLNRVTYGISLLQNSLYQLEMPLLQSVNGLFIDISAMSTTLDVSLHSAQPFSASPPMLSVPGGVVLPSDPGWCTNTNVTTDVLKYLRCQNVGDLSFAYEDGMDQTAISNDLLACSAQTINSISFSNLNPFFAKLTCPQVDKFVGNDDRPSIRVKNSQMHMIFPLMTALSRGLFVEESPRLRLEAPNITSMHGYRHYSFAPSVDEPMMISIPIDGEVTDCVLLYPGAFIPFNHTRLVCEISRATQSVVPH